MRKSLLGFLSIAVVTGFFLLPAEQIPAKVTTSVTYAPPGTFTVVGGSPWHQSDGTQRITTADRSGLRRAFEGRLKWLGVADEVAIWLPCGTDEDGRRVCSRLL